MDEFAQTRGADDLFDDEIIFATTEEQSQIQSEVEAQGPMEKHNDESLPMSRCISEPSYEARLRPKRGGLPGWRRKGRADHPARKAAEAHGGQRRGSAQGSAEESEEQISQGSDARSSPKQQAETNQHVPAVRGDRSATGGVRKPKLSAEELDKRIASARENAAKVAAAHARAQADLASFLERERAENEKRRVEGENRRVMNSERARNRERKLKTVNGREWDAAKQENHNARGTKGYRRGVHGAIAWQKTNDSAWNTRNVDTHKAATERSGGTQSKRGHTSQRGSKRRNEHNKSPRDSLSPSSISEHPSELTSLQTPGPLCDANPKLPESSKKNNEESSGQTKAGLPVSGDSWAEEMEAQQ